MIYIHCQNLGLRFSYIKTINILDANAEHFSWLFKLSDKEEVKDQYTVAIKMPDELADNLIWEFISSNSTYTLSTFLGEMFDNDEFRKMFREQLELSVHTNLVNRRFCGDMAKKIEQTHLDDHEQAIFDLLNQIDFPRWAEVEI
jgi:hypothetical protein